MLRRNNGKNALPTAHKNNGIKQPVSSKSTGAIVVAVLVVFIILVQAFRGSGPPSMTKKSVGSSLGQMLHAGKISKEEVRSFALAIVLCCIHSLLGVTFIRSWVLRSFATVRSIHSLLCVTFIRYRVFVTLARQSLASMMITFA
jgi:hypothetical protein